VQLTGFDYQTIKTSGAVINVAVKGEGEPLLLLHGYPQTHLIWRDVAPALAESFKVVCADLRGYGDSSKPEGLSDHSNYSKRAMAVDMIEVMAALGHTDFLLAGHDRGGRVAYRLALDYPGTIRRLALLDIVSTRAIYARSDMNLARAYFHWYFLIQQRPIPEKMIESQAAAWLKAFLPAGSSAVFQEYLRTFATPEGIHASCEDYRAGFYVDRVQDEADVAAGRKITCPNLILWGKQGVIGRVFEPLESWRDLIEVPAGEGVDCGHFIPEERPEETVRLIGGFMRAP
jgi:haloacetate dehalogenase